MLGAAKTKSRPTAQKAQRHKQSATFEPNIHQHLNLARAKEASLSALKDQKVLLLHLSERTPMGLCVSEGLPFKV